MPTLFAKDYGRLVGGKCSAGYFVLNRCVIFNSQLIGRIYGDCRERNSG